MLVPLILASTLAITGPANPPVGPTSGPQLAIQFLPPEAVATSDILLVRGDAPPRRIINIQPDQWTLVSVVEGESLIASLPTFTDTGAFREVAVTPENVTAVGIHPYVRLIPAYYEDAHQVDLVCAMITPPPLWSNETGPLAKETHVIWIGTLNADQPVISDLPNWADPKATPVGYLAVQVQVQVSVSEPPADQE
ncbi:MAG: hypothetical protein ABI743_02545 [bacterium]